MAGKTNELVAWTDGAGRGAEAASSLSDDEYDVVVASGEQVTAGLLAMTLRNMGLNARSWLGWQVPIITDDAHGTARIDEIPPEKLHAPPWSAGEIAVIAGFQGVTPRAAHLHAGPRRLGHHRGGHRRGIGAARCDIYTDVDGVYTTDPRIEAKARRLAKISYEEMLEMASLGAKVLQTRSVELAMAQRVPVRVLSSFVEPGERRAGHHRLRRGGDRGKAHRQRRGLQPRRGQDHPVRPARPSGRLLGDLRPLADANVNVDMIVQNVSQDGETTDMEFTVGKRDAARALAGSRRRQAEIGFATSPSTRTWPRSR